MAGADIRDLDRVAVRASVDVVTQMAATDLARPTPCQAWTLRDLLARMTAQHHGFAAAARGDGADLAGWAVDDGWEADPVRAYAAAADDLILAFASDDVTVNEYASGGSQDSAGCPEEVSEFEFTVLHAPSTSAVTNSVSANGIAPIAVRSHERAHQFHRKPGGSSGSRA